MKYIATYENGFKDKPLAILEEDHGRVVATVLGATPEEAETMAKALNEAVKR